MKLTNKTEDLTGQVFGKLTVVEFAGYQKKAKRPYWLCRCSCGGKRVVLSTSLKNGKTKSCGCLNTNSGTTNPRFKDLTKTKLPNGILALKLIKFKDKKSVWLFRCHCGKEFQSFAKPIKSGFKKSCGCLYNKGKNNSRFVDRTKEELPNGIKALKFLYFTDNHKSIWLFRCHCGREFEANASNIRSENTSSCGCLYANTSKAEGEIFAFLKNELGIKEIIKNTKKVINPLELDLYLPEHNIAIEYNGIYWHSEKQGKDRRYHVNKTDKCLEKGIQLIQIFETEWTYKKEIIKSILRAKLGKLTKLCGGRQCKIREITVKESGPFLNTHHRQGSSPSSIKLGAYFNDELVSVMTFSKPSVAKGRKHEASSTTKFELARFASLMGHNIPGIASKILSHFKKNYAWDELLTFADRRYSNTKFYEKVGFTLLNTTAPCYWYHEERSIDLKHRFKYRKQELPKLLKTFDINKTEYTNMVENGFDRIWDCGNHKLIMYNLRNNLTNK